MNKRLLIIYLLMLACAVGFAQKGRQGVGLNGGIGYFDKAQGTGWYGGLKYEHFLTDYIRLSPCLEYHHRKHFYEYGKCADYSIDAFSIKAKSDFFLFSADKNVRPYAHAGIGYVTGNTDDTYFYYTNGIKRYSGEKEDLKGLNLRAGLGLDWLISYAMAVQFEVAYDCAMDEERYGHIDFGVGLTYYFK